MEKHYGKLVRDNIPQIIRLQGNIPIVHTLDSDEYKKSLIKKLEEEVAEFLEDNNISEICDILEVLEALIDSLGYTKEEVQKVKNEKARTNGAFNERVFLEKVIVK